MPDLSSLPELASAPADDDLFLVQDASASAPKDKKIKKSNLFDGFTKVGSDASFNDLTVNDIDGVDATFATIEAGALAFTDGAGVAKMFTVTDTINLSSVAAGSTATDTASLTGVATGDFVLFSATTAAPDGLIIQAYVSASNTITVRAHNPTASTITGGTYNFRFVVMRFT